MVHSVFVSVGVKIQVIGTYSYIYFNRYFCTIQLFKNAVQRLSTRALSTAAHQPPVKIHGIHARYANAAYVAASKQGILDQVSSELNALLEATKKHAGLKNLLENPIVSREEKSSALETLLAGSASPVTMNLLTTMAGNARLAEYEKVVGVYEEFMKATRGEVEATIISADPLTKAQTDQISKAIEAELGGSAKKVILSTEVDESLLGGLQVQIGDKFLDLSVSSRIDALSRASV